MTTAVQAISRIKLMAQMDITEKRLAQDGHIPDASKRHQADVRIGTGPTIHGERAVLRLMPDATSFAGLRDLGLTEDQQRRLEKSVTAPSGIMLFVGPVGSGKSTTTYTCRAMLNRPERCGRHDRRPRRAADARGEPDPDRHPDRVRLRRSRCGGCCGRIRTSSWSARSATPRRPTSRSGPR